MQYLQWPTNRNSHMIYRTTTFSIRDVNGYPGSRDPNLLPEPGKLSTRNNTRTYPIPGSGLIQLARARYQTAWRSVAESPAHCTNAPQHTWPTKLCCEAWTAWGREIADWQDRLTCGGDGVDRNSISIVS